MLLLNSKINSALFFPNGGSTIVYYLPAAAATAVVLMGSFSMPKSFHPFVDGGGCGAWFIGDGYVIDKAWSPVLMFISISKVGGLDPC